MSRERQTLHSTAHYSSDFDAEYLSLEELARLAVELAAHPPTSLVGFSAPFRFKDPLAVERRTITKVYRSVRAAASRGETLTPAAEWLLDHFHLIEENVRQVVRDLPPRFYRELPAGVIARDLNAPRALALAWLCIVHSNCEFGERRLTALIEAHQRIEPLRIGELWAMPSMLRVVLLLRLERIAVLIERRRSEREQANTLADKLLATDEAVARREALAGVGALADSDAFASQLLYRLRDGAATTRDIVDWLDARLAARGSDAEEALIAEQTRLSAGNVTIGNIIGSLRALDDVDWRRWIGTVSRVDRLLSNESDFAALDFATRDSYRNAIEWLSRHSGIAELEVARQALDCAADEPVPARGVSALASRNVGAWLVGDERERMERTLGARIPLGQRLNRRYRSLGWRAVAYPVVLLTVVFTLCGAVLLQSSIVGPWTLFALLLLAALPASEAASGLFNTVATFLCAPTHLCGYVFEGGLPAEARTLVVVPCLIGSHDGIDDLVRGLEVHYLANTQGEIYFALLSDWPDSHEQRNARDDELLEHARAGIDKLEHRYARGGQRRFFLLHRRRLWNRSDEIWMGWERKRGKLLELNQLLRGESDTSFLSFTGALPEGVRFVMTLDSDTRLTRDAVTRLAGKLAHPLNHPVVDAFTNSIIGGHAILQPRVTPSLTSGSEASVFQRVFSVNRGLDPYVFTVSDVYQDLFDEGSFTGKGLYDVDAFSCVLAGRFEDNSILSHDLLEGSLARSALVTDVELVEDFPTRYETEVSRQHRWARGDWQLLPFVAGADSGLSTLGRWKMLDNLRRSLVTPAWLAATLLGWCTLQPAIALLWQLGLVASLFVSPTLALVRGFAPHRGDGMRRSRWRTRFDDTVDATAQVVLRIVFIAHSAAVMLDAVVRTLYRMFFSRRHLLEWRTAAAVESVGRRGIGQHYHLMYPSVLMGMTSLVLVLLVQPHNAAIAWPFVLAWIGAPFVAWIVSRSAETEDRLDVTPDDALALRLIGRRTWVYFDTFVTAEHNFLPPDNYQESPEPVVAARTSPTNVGVYLLSIVSARDFGWIGFGDTLARIEATLGTLERIVKHHGHMLNWYDTRSLEPLLPRYVSAVDSGNLAGHLVTLSSVCAHWAQAPYVHLHTGIDGLHDTAVVMAEELSAVPDDRRALRPLRIRLEERLAAFRRATRPFSFDEESDIVPARVVDLVPLAADIRKLVAELDTEIDSSQIRSVFDWSERLVDVCAALLDDEALALLDIDPLRARLQRSAELARLLAFSMDFAFLLNPRRRLLAIGYRVEDDELDSACYDLLASEARLTSLFAIAKGDIPTEHWFRLGRPTVPVGTRGALVSWSGSMFEYLMPPLIMQEQLGGILNQTSRLVCRRQIEYGKARGVPWGVSEAAFNARDNHLTYQYSCFGVPSLGMKSGLGANLVIAPYATILASQYVPAQAVRNLARLRKLGALGRYGFHDALDFTPRRLPDGESHVVVRNFMAHHHGMSILAISNVVFNGRLRERFHEDPVIEAVELLLQEKAPRVVPIPTTYLATEAHVGQSELPGPEVRLIEEPATAPRATALLSNGHYSLALAATGGGRALWNGLAVTRWHPDASEDRHGTFLFLRDLDSGEWWSATVSPRAAQGEVVHTVFSDSKAEFHKSLGTLRSVVDVGVGSESDAERRRITLENLGPRDRRIEITSYAEPVLALAAADAAHPVFSKMFLETSFDREHDAIHVRRKPRASDEPDMHVVHLLVVDAAEGRERTEFETDRRSFIGRGRCLSDACAFDPGVQLSGSEGFTLDPIMALRRRVRVPVGKKTSLSFWTIVAPTRAEADVAIQRYRHPESFDREAMHAWTRSQVQLRHFGISGEEAAVFQRLAAYLLYPDPLTDPGLETGKPGPQSALWSLGISGDLPIVLVRIDAEGDLEIVRKGVRAQEYFRARGLAMDLVIVNEQSISYVQSLQQAIESLCDNARSRSGLADGREHLFVLRRDQIDETAHVVLTAIARIVLHARNGRFSTHLDRIENDKHRRTARGTDDPERRHSPRPSTGPVPSIRSEESASKEAKAIIAAVEADAARHSELGFWNGYGGFDSATGDYVIHLPAKGATPQPWINVIANEHFGFHVSAEGGSYTWSLNSRDHPLTPWSNDPVIDRPGETLHVVDLDTRLCISPFAGQSDRSVGDARFEVRHRPGSTRFIATDVAGLDLELVQFVAGQDTLKRSVLTIAARDGRVRRLRVYAAAEWALGNDPVRSAPAILTWQDAMNGALLASNPFSIEHGERVAFLAADRLTSSWTTNRRELIGRGTAARPDAIVYGRRLQRSEGRSGDSCAALAIDIAIDAVRSEVLEFALGDAGSDEEARTLIKHAFDTDPTTALDDIDAQWNDVFDVVGVETPDAALNMMVNRWLPYQALACRLAARSAFYQASGASGFRDQLQDSLAFLLHDPGIARARILAAASRQFPEGDVQHWWLPGTGAGVRTTIADDVVWLAYATTHFVEVTGDDSILDEPVAFIEGPELEPGQHDAFFEPVISAITEPLLEHMGRALDLAVARTGAQGLPLFLGGDWNDGMNRVGEAGRGESVWLGWFLLGVLEPSAVLAETRGDAVRAQRWRSHANELESALATAGWDGQWYRRGYFDDGTPFGSKQSDECRIDSIAQSWSVLSRCGDPARSAQALDAVMRELVDKDNGIVRLFTPPFANTEQEPGYIKGYPPGVRENGGQYTHAATWMVQALADSGRLDDALACFRMLNPIGHALDRTSAERYRVEPYVVAADIYGDGDKCGRGGWTWYTGSAGWLFRVALEGVLGIRKTGNRLRIRPLLPSDWDGWTVQLRLDGRRVRIQTRRDADGQCVVEVDGVIVEDPELGVPIEKSETGQGPSAAKSGSPAGQAAVISGDH